MNDQLLQKLAYALGLTDEGCAALNLQIVDVQDCETDSGKRHFSSLEQLVDALLTKGDGCALNLRVAGIQTGATSDTYTKVETSEANGETTITLTLWDALSNTAIGLPETICVQSCVTNTPAAVGGIHTPWIDGGGNPLACDWVPLNLSQNDTACADGSVWNITDDLSSLYAANLLVSHAANGQTLVKPVDCSQPVMTSLGLQITCADGSLSNTATHLINYTPAPLGDIRIEKTFTDDIGNPIVNTGPGDTVQIILSASNIGVLPSNITGITVTDLLPGGLTYVSDTPSSGTYDNITGEWTGFTLAGGVSETLTIVATVGAAGFNSIANIVTATGDDGTGPNTTNDTDIAILLEPPSPMNAITSSYNRNTARSFDVCLTSFIQDGLGTMSELNPGDVIRLQIPEIGIDVGLVAGNTMTNVVNDVGSTSWTAIAPTLIPNDVNTIVDPTLLLTGLCIEVMKFDYAQANGLTAINAIEMTFQIETTSSGITSAQSNTLLERIFSYAMDNNIGGPVYGDDGNTPAVFGTAQVANANGDMLGTAVAGSMPFGPGYESAGSSCGINPYYGIGTNLTVTDVQYAGLAPQAVNIFVSNFLSSGGRFGLQTITGAPWRVAISDTLHDFVSCSHRVVGYTFQEFRESEPRLEWFRVERTTGGFNYWLEIEVREVLSYRF